jgi:hypothetical protein
MHFICTLVWKKIFILVKSGCYKILRKDFTVDDTEREALVDKVYDTTQHFVSMYDFSALNESNYNASPSVL